MYSPHLPLPPFRLVCGVEYCGTEFYGWQNQDRLPSIQGALYNAFMAWLGLSPERAQALGGEPQHWVAAGRTDRGVHAREQVTHWECPNALTPIIHERLQKKPLETWPKGINAYLPPSIRVLWARLASPAFCARKSATSRHYRYVLLSRRTPPANLSTQIGWTWRPINIALMQSAAKVLVGTHDFSAFRSSECQAPSPIRTLLQCTVESQHSAWFSDGGEPATLMVAHFQANAFLHHMIRNFMGSLIEVASGKRDVAWLGEVLASRDRTRAGMTFMANGLYFWKAEYPDGLFH
jgi:tRNA pseudouridine38-40 synthase